jgi:hypothetical protein
MARAMRDAQQDSSLIAIWNLPMRYPTLPFDGPIYWQLALHGGLPCLGYHGGFHLIPRAQNRAMKILSDLDLPSLTHMHTTELHVFNRGYSSHPAAALTVLVGGRDWHFDHRLSFEQAYAPIQRFIVLSHPGVSKDRGKHSGTPPEHFAGILLDPPILI